MRISIKKDGKIRTGIRLNTTIGTEKEMRRGLAEKIKRGEGPCFLGGRGVKKERRGR